MKDSSVFSRHRTISQNTISGIVLFFTVGIYLAVLGLGAGGGKPSSQRVNDISNSLLYGFYAVFGFFTGAILNQLGPRITMTIGAVGYPIYIGALFYYDRTGNEWSPILGGALLGLSAPMLWSVSGFIQWAYATEAEKGKYIAIQYFINQVGSVVGSLVAFMLIYKGALTAEGSPTSVYIAFLVLMAMGLVFTLFGLVRTQDVRRADGTAIGVFHRKTLTQEVKGVLTVLRDYRVLAMLPVILSCELALGILPSINGQYFTLRARAMNNVLFYAVQLPASIGCAWLTDRLPYCRRYRGYISLISLGIIVFGGWIILLIWVSVSKTWASPPAGGVHWSDGEFAGPFVLYLVFGVIYGSHQQIGMWVMGTFTNDPSTLAIYGGLWKGVAAAGVAIQFGMAAAKVSYQYVSNPLWRVFQDYFADELLLCF